MRKRIEKARTPYGEYTVSYERPERNVFNWNVFKLRLEALRRHEGFRDYCARPDIEDVERDILRAWMDLQGWLSKGPTDYEKCLLIYGNIHRLQTRTLWTRYTNSLKSYEIALQAFPFQELKPGTPAPEGMLTVSMDPHIRRDELVRIFEKFLTDRRKAFTIEAAGDPLRGYFEITEMRFNIDTTRRYLAVHKLRQEAEKKRLQAGGGRTKHWTVYKWREEVFKKFPQVYTGSEKTKREKANKELKCARSIISWVVKGRFPYTDRKR